VLPEGDYVAVQAKNPNEVWIMSENAALNACHQELTVEAWKYNVEFRVSGKELIGIPVHAPLSP